VENENRMKKALFVSRCNKVRNCVCSLTFHARCWPADVLFRAPLWCRDRRSLRQRSNNDCSKTEQVSSGINFPMSNANVLSWLVQINRAFLDIFGGEKQFIRVSNNDCSYIYLSGLRAKSIDLASLMANGLKKVVQILTIYAIASFPFLVTSNWP